MDAADLVPHDVDGSVHRTGRRQQVAPLRRLHGDVLVGASSLGLTEHVGVLRGLIQSKTRLGGWKQKLIDNPNRIMEAYLASTQAVGYNAHVL